MTIEPLKSPTQHLRECIRAEIRKELERRLDPRNRKPQGEWGTYVIPYIVCADGHQLYVQASKFHMCYPQNNEGPWTSVQVGVMGGYRPIELVVDMIAEHGGFAKDDPA